MKTQLYVIGLTGPTGAGKSTVAALLQEAGLPVLYADEAAREVTLPGTACLSALAAEFGPDILRADGSLNRRLLASRAFASREATDRLNQITHPHILRLLNDRMAALAAAGASAAVLDAPQLFESGLDAVCDKTVAILADDTLRLQRIMARDGLSEQAARVRMSAGLPAAFFERRCDECLYNNGDTGALAAQVCTLKGGLFAS